MSQENVDLLAAALAALNRGDIDVFLEMVHPEVEFVSLLFEMEGQSYRGHEGVRGWWATASESGATRYEPERIEAFRGRGVNRVRIAVVHEGVEVPQSRRSLPPLF